MLLHYPRCFGAMRQDDLRILSHQVRRCGIRTGVVAGEAQYELQITALTPSKRREPLREGGEIALYHRVAPRETHEHPDPPHPRLLPPRRNRPRSRHSAEQRDELAAFHSAPRW
jgi:hypothetical protein